MPKNRKRVASIPEDLYAGMTFGLPGMEVQTATGMEHALARRHSTRRRLLPLWRL